MNFSIEIRNKQTGEAKNFPSLQDIANFLAGKDPADWEGFTHLGALPLPEPQEPVAAAPAAAPEQMQQEQQPQPDQYQPAAALAVIGADVRDAGTAVSATAFAAGGTVVAESQQALVPEGGDVAGTALDLAKAAEAAAQPVAPASSEPQA